MDGDITWLPIYTNCKIKKDNFTRILFTLVWICFYLIFVYAVINAYFIQHSTLGTLTALDMLLIFTYWDKKSSK